MQACGRARHRPRCGLAKPDIVVWFARRPTLTASARGGEARAHGRGEGTAAGSNKGTDNAASIFHANFSWSQYVRAILADPHVPCSTIPARPLNCHAQAYPPADLSSPSRPSMAPGSTSSRASSRSSPVRSSATSASPRNRNSRTAYGRRGLLQRRFGRSRMDLQARQGRMI